MLLYNFQRIKHGIIRRQFYGAQAASYAYVDRIVASYPVRCALRTDQLNYGNYRHPRRIAENGS
jgi:hypothetical protein